MAESPSRAIILCGTEEAPAAPRRLSAGLLAVELQNGEVRHLSYNGVEVLRGISFLIRDASWATYGPEITNLTVEESSDGFRVAYDGQCSDADQRFRYKAEITGIGDGALSFAVTGQAETEFETNRLGFVVLHPLAGVAGEPAQVEHTDGQVEDTRFPRYISPDQPIYDIRSLTHQVVDGLEATCTMVGDAFEMEDQRNWTDASFKTYIRPLAKPRPYTMAQGAEVEQSVSLAFSGTAPRHVEVRTPGEIAVTVGSATGGTIPRIGLALAAEFGEASLAEATSIKTLAPQFMVCEFDAARHDAEVLRRHQSYCDAVGAEAVLELVVAAEAEPAEEVSAVARMAAQAGFKPTSVSIFPAPYLQSRQPDDPQPDIPPFSAYYAAARAAFPGCTIGGGSYSYFTELNRARNGGKDGLDYITHTTCPIVHDAEDGAVMESIEALPHVIDSTRQFSGGVPYRIGPSNLGMRYRPYGIVPALGNPDNIRLAMARVDPRQRGLFGAAWHLGYVAEATRGGLEAVALSAPVGPFGVVYCKTDFVQPFYDGSDDAVFYPVYHVLAGLARGAGRPMLDATSSNWSRVQCVAWQSDQGPEIWLANLTADAQEIAIGGLVDGPLQVQTMDAACFLDAASNAALLQGRGGLAPLTAALTLDAYAVARISSAP